MRLFSMLMLVCLIAALWPSRSLAAGQTQIAKHPYLYFAAAAIDRIKASGYATPAYLYEQSFTVAYYGGMTITYSLPTAQPPDREPPPGFTAGAYPYWTGLTRQLQIRLEALSLSYVSTGDERYAKRAIAYALALADWQTWVEPVYNNSLSVSHLTMGVCTVYDLLYDQMSEQERAKIRQALLEKGIRGLLTFSRNWSKAIHNGAALIHSALGFAALTLLGEENVDGYLNSAREYAGWWLNEAMTSGQTEGVSYTGYSLEYLTRFLLALKNATGEAALLRHPYFTEHLTQSLIYFSGSDFRSIVNFGDSGYGSYSSYILPLTILNLAEGDAHAGWLLRQWGVASRSTSADFAAVVYNVGTIKEAQPPTAWPTAAVTPFGWVAMRTGWDPRDAVLAFTSSPSEQGHNHFDQNHFTLNVNGEWLLVDYGSKDYAALDYTVGTESHNSLLFDGQGQLRRGGGRMERFVDSPGISYAVGDASGAYNGELSWKRHILQVKPGGYYIFMDEVKAQSAKAAFFGSGSITPKVFSFLLHPAAGLQRTTADGSALTGSFQGEISELVFIGDRAAALWQAIWPAQVQATLTWPENAPGHAPYFKIGADAKVMDTLLISLLKGAAGTAGVDAPEIKVAPESSPASFFGLEATRADGRDLIIWNRSGKPSSWHGVETDGELACLSFDVDGNLVAASLVGGATLKYHGSVPENLARL